MTTAATPLSPTAPALAPAVPLRRPGLAEAVSDGAAMAWRNLLGLRRNPQLLVFATVQPVLFVLMFRYVFGGAISVPGVRYVDYLMPGIFAQTVAFGAVQTAVGLAEDRSTGLVERLQSLPMARSAVLTGRTSADFVRNAFVTTLMVVVGFAVGFRIHAGVAAFVAAVLILLAFGYALAWVFSLIGLSASGAESAQAAVFPILMPFVFASTAFVPLRSMPGWLQAFAEHQPVSVTVDAVRALTLGGPTTGPVLEALAWIAGILLVAVPLAVRRYRRAV